MIHTNRVVTVGDQESIIDKPIILYRGDREVEVEFELIGNEFMFSTNGNVIKSVNASHGQLVLNTPSGDNMFSELAECHDGKVVFVITKEMIDEFIEIGFYSFQIRLYDGEQMKSRVTIPPVFSGLDIRNPIAAEDETNVVGMAVVDYARIYRDQSNEELPTFDWAGNYIKTDWVHHDIITENKMNKIEDAIWTVNNKISESDNVFLKKAEQLEVQRQNDVNKLNSKDTQLTNDIQNVNRNLTNEVNKLRVDMEVGDASVKNELTKYVSEVNSQLAHIAIQVNHNGVDDTQNIQNAIDVLSLSGGGKLLLHDENYIIESVRVYSSSNITIEGNGATLKQLSNTIEGIINIKDSDNITIKGVKLEGCNQAVSTKTGYQYTGIKIQNSNFITINECEISKMANTGLLFLECNNITVKNNYLHDNLDGADIYAGYDIPLDELKNYWIQDNHCEDGNLYGIAVMGYGKNVTITNNHVNRKNEYGIMVYRKGKTDNDVWKNVVLTGNIVENVSHNPNVDYYNGMGIYLQTVEKVVVSNNIVKKVLLNRPDISAPNRTLAPGGISINGSREVTCIGNIVEDSGIDGIDVVNVEKTTKGTIVSNNVIINPNAHGVCAQANENLNIASNIIFTEISSKIGINVYSHSLLENKQINICDNQIRGTFVEGVNISKGTGSEIVGVSIKGNHISNIKGSYISCSYSKDLIVCNNLLKSIDVLQNDNLYAIVVTNSDFCNIQGNLIKGEEEYNFRRGIYLGVANNSIVSQNNVQGVEQAGYSIYLANCINSYKINNLTNSTFA